MFFIQQIIEGDKYCVCYPKWRYFKIVNYEIVLKELNVYLRPDNSRKTLLYNISLGCGENIKHPLFLNEYEFGVNQHVQIEVIGGSITIVGQIYEGAEPNWGLSKNAFHPACAFAEFEGESLATSTTVDRTEPQKTDVKDSSQSYLDELMRTVDGMKRN